MSSVIDSNVKVEVLNSLPKPPQNDQSSHLYQQWMYQQNLLFAQQQQFPMGFYPTMQQQQPTQGYALPYGVKQPRIESPPSVSGALQKAGASNGYVNSPQYSDKTFEKKTKKPKSDQKNLRHITVLRSYKSSQQQVSNAIDAIMSNKDLVEKEVTICIAALRRLGQWKKATMLLKDMVGKGLKPNVITYSAVISACEKAQQWEKALELLSEMHALDIKPNVISYSAAISACEKCQRYQEALDLLQEMKNHGIQPDVIAYNATISACEKGHQGQKAIELLDEMISKNIKASVISYNATISACEKSLLFNEALSIFQRMCENGVLPDMISYNAIISACCKCNEFNLALKKFKEMKEAGLSPDVVTFCPLITSCVNDSNYDKAWKLYEEMRQFHINPNVSLFQQICQMCELSKDVNRLIFLSREIPPISKKNPKSYSNHCVTIMRAFTNLNMDEECISFFANECSKTPQPSSDPFAVAIEACARKGNFQHANMFLELCVQQGVPVSTHIINTVLIANCVANEYNIAMRLFFSMETRYNCPIDIHSINAMIEGCCISHKFDYGLLYEQIMIERQLVPTKVTSILLISIFSNLGNAEKERTYIQMMQNSHSECLSRESDNEY